MDTIGTRSAVYAASPTVRVDGREHESVNRLLVGMAMTEREGGLSALELRFSNVASRASGGADLAFEDEAVMRLGALIAVYSGDRIDPREIFRGTITGLEGDYPVDAAPELVVLAEDALQGARMTRKTRTFADQSPADLARRIANEHELTPIVSGLDEPVGTWVQLDESDLAFLGRIVGRFDGDVQVVGRELHASARREVRRTQLALRLHGALRRARVVADLAHQATEVTTAGWDPLRGVRVVGRATGTDLGPGSGRTGAEILRDALGDRSVHHGDINVAAETEARTTAEAIFDRRARRFVRIDGTAEGNPDLRVGTHVALSGLGPRFDNTYYVIHACHRFDLAHGYETHFAAECAYLGGGR